MNEEAALREQIRVAGEVLASLAQRLAGTIFLLEAADSAMNPCEAPCLITQASFREFSHVPSSTRHGRNPLVPYYLV